MHQSTAFGDERERLFELDHAGGTCGGVFPQALSHHPGGFDAPGAPHFDEGVLQSKEGRLRVVRTIEQGARFAIRIQHIDESVLQMGA